MANKLKLSKQTLKSARFSKINLAVFILVFAGIGGYVLLSSHAAGSMANVFVSPNGTDTGANCLRFATPATNPDPTGTSLCASFDKAYRLASPGDTVEVEAGSYASQYIPYTSAKPNNYHCDWAVNNDIYNPTSDYSGCITFVPASGATVNLTGLRSEVPYLKLDGGTSKSFRFDRTNPLAGRSFDYCEITTTLTPLTAKLTGNITSGSPVISGLTSTAGLVVGYDVVDDTSSDGRLPADARIVSIDSSTQVTVSKNATVTRFGDTFEFDTGQLALNGTTTAGSTAVTGLSDTSGLAVKLAVTGTGVPAGTVITSVDSASQVTLSQAVTASGSPSLTFVTGCYYGGSSIALGAGPKTSAYTCYGLTGLPQAQGHDDVIANIWSNDTFVLSGKHNAIIDSTFDVGDSWRPNSGTSHMEGCHDTSVTPSTAPGDYLELAGVTIKNLLLTHPSNACVSGSTCPTGWMSYHVAPLHWEGGTNSRVVRSWFENNGGHNIELEPEDGYPTADNLLIENSIFGALCANQTTTSNGGYCADQGGAQVTDCHSTGGTVSNVVWRFNDFAGSSYNKFSQDNANCSWGGQLLSYANVNTGAAPDASSFACTSQLSQTGVAWNYNLWASGTSPCGSNSVIGDPKLTSSSYPVDPHLQAGSPAIDAIPAGSGYTACPATDYYGNSRPQGSACDAGAVEYIETPNVWVSPTGDDTACVRGDSTKPCATFNKAYSLAQCGDVVSVVIGQYQGQTVNYSATQAACAGNPIIFQGAGQDQTIVGTRTKTTADIDMYNGGDIPVVSTAGFYISSSSGTYVAATGNSNFDCTGKTATSFTDCHAENTCQPTSGDECGWAAGTDLHEGGISITGASYVTFKDMTAQTISVKDDGTNPAAYVTFDGLHTYGGYIDQDHTTLKNGECGPSAANERCLYVSNAPNTTISHMLIHELTHNCIATPEQTDANRFCHGDGFYISGISTNLTYDHNRSYGNSPWTLFFSNAGDYSGLTIEDNFFGSEAPGTSYSMSLRSTSGRTWNNVTIKGNSFSQNPIIGLSGDDRTGVIFTNWLISGNINIEEPENCPSALPSDYTTYDVTYTYNLTSGAACTSPYVHATGNVGNASLGSSIWTNSSTGDMHLISDSTPAGGIVASGCLVDDYDDDARLAPCDAGADEYSSSYVPPAIPGDLNKDGHVNVLDLSMLLSHWQSTDTTADINASGKVDILDLSILLSHYGS